MVAFSLIQFVLVACVFWMFCKQRLYRAPSSASSSGGRKISDAAATAGGGGVNSAGGEPNLILDESGGEAKKEEIFKVENTRLEPGRDRLFMRGQDNRKPRFTPRRPVEFLRDSPVSLRNYNL